MNENKVSLLLVKENDKDGNSWGGIVVSMKNLVAIHKNKPNSEGFPVRDYQFVFRWGCRGSIPEREARGIKVVNSAKAITRTMDKGEFRKLIPDLCPRTVHSIRKFVEDPFYPCVARPINHLMGQDFYLCNDVIGVGDAIEEIDSEYYIQEYIEKVKEYRVYFIQGRVVAVSEKVPNTECKDKPVWNMADEVNIRWSDWPGDVVFAATRAFTISKLNFGAVDVIDDDERSYVLEINTAPEITNYRQEIFAKVFDYMIDNDNADNIPITQLDENWKGYIHPALSDQAVV